MNDINAATVSIPSYIQWLLEVKFCFCPYTLAERKKLTTNTVLDI